MQFDNMQELIELAIKEKKHIYDLIIDFEVETSQRSKAIVIEEMKNNWLIMRKAILKGIENEEKSTSGLVGNNAKVMYQYLNQKQGGYLGVTALKASAYAIAVSEVNAVMGKIVACPTAGSCGILPAAVFAAAEKNKYSEAQIIDALFTAAGVGMIIAKNASISGAEGGCQAECGSAAAMAAAALVELEKGTPQQIGNGVALALKNMLGLVCDPVAGLVEVPCVKRNGFATVQAILAADMALAEIQSIIPVDEVISAMYQIGVILPKSLKETSEGGLANTPTARKIEAILYQK